MDESTSGGTARPEPAVVERPRFVSAPRTLDIRIPAAFAPFDLTPEANAMGVTVYGREASGTATLDAGGDGWIRQAAWESATPDSSRLVLRLKEPLWGMKAFYDSDGTLVLRLRRPPERSQAQGGDLHGLRILVDAGHPPGGAIGPTGLREAEANLAIAQRVAAQLRERGARVVMTRTSPAPLESASWTPGELWARVDRAISANAHLLVSIHNNAFPDGVNPFDNVGTEVYYFHPFAKPLASALADGLAPVTGLPNRGARRRSLALVRPTWMPAVLTESLYLMMPQHEAALRNPAFLDRLAEAHVQGIVRFVEAHAPGRAP
jgi:N-acetylmuramoyl-L-alanine amidase